MLTSFVIPLTIFVSLSPWLLTCEAAEGSFCYNNSESCRPSNWAGSCNVGTHQSPISLPLFQAPDLSSSIQLTLNNYKSSAFRMQNTGHSVEFEFKSTTEDTGTGTQGRRIFGGRKQNKTGESGGKATTPDISQYTLYRGHFHWGANDNVGSEHCYDGNQCFSMELHLVHYLSSYGDINQAIASNDSDALAVIGVFLQASAVSTGEGSQAIAPIVKNMGQVTQPSTKESPNWYTVNTGLDFSSLLSRQNYMYTYKGSLTTPNCNEIVNWFVLQRPVGISQNDVRAFRKVMDSHGEPMTTNHRPIQKKEGRSVNLSIVRTS